MVVVTAVAQLLAVQQADQVAEVVELELQPVALAILHQPQYHKAIMEVLHHLYRVR
jgi:hypothetical protein